MKPLLVVVPISAGPFCHSWSNAPTYIGVDYSREFTKPQFSQNSGIKLSLGDRCLSLRRIAATCEERFRQMGLLYEI